VTCGAYRRALHSRPGTRTSGNGSDMDASKMGQKIKN
jgi:hypothetical protein